MIYLILKAVWMTTSRSISLCPSPSNSWAIIQAQLQQSSHLRLTSSLILWRTNFYGSSLENQVTTQEKMAFMKGGQQKGKKEKFLQVSSLAP